MKKNIIKNQLDKLADSKIPATILVEAMTLLTAIEALDQKELASTIDKDKDIIHISQFLFNTHSTILRQFHVAGHLWGQVIQPNLHAFNQLCGLYYYTLAWGVNHPVRRQEPSPAKHHLPTLLKAVKMGSGVAANLVVVYFIEQVKKYIRAGKAINYEKADQKVENDLQELPNLLIRHLTPGALLLGQAYLFASTYFFSRENPIFQPYAEIALKYLWTAMLLIPYSSKQILNFYGKKQLKDAIKVPYRVFFTEEKPPQSIFALISQQQKNLAEAGYVLDDKLIQKQARQLFTSMSEAGLVTHDSLKTANP